jgi:aminoglycoside phosphotransferase (APT) family kinase protein
MSEASLPPAVAALAESALGGAIIGLAPTVGGFSNLSRRAQIGGQTCVIKAAQLSLKRADLHREAAVLPLLPARQILAPPLLALVEDETWTVLITAELPGLPGVALLEGDRHDLPAVCVALGSMLARLHAGPAPKLPSLALGPHLMAARKTLDCADVSGELRSALLTALDSSAWAESPCLIHGDSGIHNLLWDGRRAALLDWEWAAAGPPAFDLAWLRWTMRWRGLPEDRWHEALESYGRPAISDHILHALALGQIAMILARAVGQPAARAEWLRRALWTLAW